MDQAAAPQQVTAVLVLPASFGAQNQIFQEFYTNPVAQAAFPGEELGEFFELIDQAVDLLTLVGYLILVIAALTVFLAMYNATLAQAYEIAIMRGLGSQRTTIFRVVLFETLLVTLLGALLGRLLDYPAVTLIAATLSDQSALPIPIRVLPQWELALVLIPLGIGAIAGLLPAIMAYRVNVVEKLFPT